MKEHKNNKYLVLEVKKELFRVLEFSFYKENINVVYFEEFIDIQKLESLFEDEIKACVISFSKDIDKKNIVKIENEIKKLNINLMKILVNFKQYILQFKISIHLVNTDHMFTLYLINFLIFEMN